MSKHESKEVLTPAAADDGSDRESVMAIRLGRGRTGGSTVLDRQRRVG